MVSQFPLKAAQPPPQFSAHVYCGQTVGWLKTSLGRDVDVIVLDGSQFPSAKKAQQLPPLFSVHIYCGHGRELTAELYGRPME